MVTAMGYVLGVLVTAGLLWKAHRELSAASRNGFQRTEDREWWI